MSVLVDNLFPYNFTSFSLKPRSAPPVIPTHRAENLESLKSRVSAESAYQLTESDKNQLKALYADLGKNGVYHFLNQLETNALLTIAALSEEQAKQKIITLATLKDEALKSVLQSKGKAIWREMAPQVVDFMHHLMGIFIGFIEISEIGGEQIMGSYHAVSKLQLYSTLLGYPAIVFGSVYACVGSASLAFLATAVVIIGTVAGVSIYMRCLRPCPKQHRGLENLTERVLKFDESPVFPRRELLDKIKERFESGKGALLVGDTGSGKSFLAKAFAELVAEGKIDFLKNGQMFQFNAGSLLMGAELQEIQHRFSAHEKKVVFFADEIHAAFNKENELLKSGASDLFKTFCDNFRYVIAATTTEEYAKYINTPENKAFLRRFGDAPIFVPACTKEEIEASLKMHLHHVAPELVWEADVISYVADKAEKFNPNTSQIDAAFSLLKRVIVEAKVLSFPTLEKEISGLQTELECLKIDLLNRYDAAKAKKYIQLNSECAIKEKEYQEKRAVFAGVQKIESEYVEAKRQQYLLAAKDTDGDHRKWLVNEVFSGILAEYIQDRRLKLGLPAMLDKKLVAKVLK